MKCIDCSYHTYKNMPGHKNEILFCERVWKKCVLVASTCKYNGGRSRNYHKEFTYQDSREILRLRFVEGMPARKVAGMFNIGERYVNKLARKEWEKRPFTFKRCRNCKILKPRSEFYRATNTIDGKQGICRGCYQIIYKSKTSQAPTRNPKRLPAFGMAFQCKTCGSGYDTEPEAINCCIDMSSEHSGITKYEEDITKDYETIWRRRHKLTF